MSINKAEYEIRRWQERAEIARQLNNAELESASLRFGLLCEQLESGNCEEHLVTLHARAKLLRNKIEASEQHRTMCVEHGLSDAAIDATYEIQEFEKELIELTQKL